ncbi:MAG: XdhC family protein [Oscillospiraceae bacterium]|nr:XdhC family protein [Oscillospiraceae bacterium]
MKKIYSALDAVVSAGHDAVLCSIVASHGSTPRGAGAKILVPSGGAALLGTVGGGAVEYRAEQYARKLLAEKRSEFASYRLGGEGTGDGLGMICGGEVRLYFQYFDPSDPAVKPLLKDILELLNGTQAAWTVTAAAEDGSWRMGVYDRTRGLRDLPGVSLSEVEPLLGSRGQLREGNPVLYAEPLCRAGTVYLFGGGHVGRELAHILALTGFRVVVWDERPDAAAPEIFPDAAEIHCGSYSGAFEKLPPVTGEDYIVIMTPGHQADYTVLAQALRTPARYIGCIGSKKKAAATREKLLDAGFTPEETDRIYSPVGLPIGGETPAEVAVSAAAQIIACRSGRLDGFAERGKHAAN